MFRKSRKEIPDKWRLLARDQAAYIHRSYEIADEIVDEALDELNVTATNQKKRLFYKGAKHRTCIYLERLHLLQHLVFRKSERWEKGQEIIVPALITERDLIVRYLAFIVRKTLHRNSLYGVTGICRFICNYRLTEMRAVHDRLADPERLKTDEEFRKYREKLREMIQKRFSKYLRFEDLGKGREKHFYLIENQNDSALWELVEESLDVFKPWETECIPADFYLQENTQSTFDHFDEHLRELKRLHALIHQDCFEVLTVTANCAAPSSRLGIPQFFFSNSSSGHLPPDPSNSQGEMRDGIVSSGLNTSDKALEKLQIESVKRNQKLARFDPKNTILIRVDDQEVARLNLSQTHQARFSITDEDSEIIELVDEAEQLILAAHLLGDEVWQSSAEESCYEVRHPHGPRILFNLQRLETAGTDNSHLSVVVTYKEARFSQFWFFLKQSATNRLSALKLRFAKGFFASWWHPPPLSLEHLKIAGLVSLMMVIGVLLMTFSSPTNQSFRPNISTVRPDASFSPAPGPGAGVGTADDPKDVKTLARLTRPSATNRLHYRNRHLTKSKLERPNPLIDTSGSTMAVTVPPQAGGCRMR
jgi:hypothetical protein